MASGLEPVPLTSQKHDPAWKHCQMFKNGDRVQLKCLYCSKIFKGGGIHRIKEHLAGQKGNASTCLRVQPDVRLLMQESLNCAVAKKRKKQKIADEITSFNDPSGSEIDPFGNKCGLNTEVELIAVPEAVELDSTLLINQEGESTSNKGVGRKKKGRVRKASRSSIPNALAVNDNTLVGSKRTNNHANMAISRFFYDVGIPLDAVKSMYFQAMVDAIASQGEAGVLAPTYHDLRSSMLKNALQEVRNDIDQCMGTWGKSGCSVLVDEWVLEKGRTLVNFLVFCPEGMTFLRSVDISDILDSPDSLYELLKGVVEEVGIRNVLQVVTNIEERYVIAAKRLTDDFPTVFWTPCAAHCIDLILEDFKKLEWINVILDQAKSILRFIYNHSVVLNMMRRYTFGVDLVDIGATRAATDFTTIKRMVNVKHNLQSMVTSEEWMECSYSKKSEGFAMLDHISSQSFWSSCILIFRLTDPLLRLLRLVGSEKRPAMGYVYAGIYRAKELIKKDQKDYLVYWNIIDHRWGKLQHHPLLAAGFYLNPKFFYSIEGDIHHQIRSSVYDCIEKLVSDPKIQDKIVKETTSYHNAVGDFGRKIAIRARDALPPGKVVYKIFLYNLILSDEWWSTYGGGCPNLARLAIRILSQTCSLISCNTDRTTIQKMHDTKNCLEHQRLSDLVFVHYNSRLRQMVRKDREQDAVDPISFENMGIVGDWVMVKEGCSEDFGSSNWMTEDPPMGNTMLLGPSTDDVEDLGAGFDDFEIFEGVKNGEEENGEDNVVSQ
ncbi:hypothetical protein RHSIM_Rhsim09G0005600 [Rhododendron simsii]|uniref:BED-type domain-containing protein n=1 Tax=Rhododendron simsii TaxID=118357 RepID=A0A834GDQ1_RHOSS|nr:hypothetical protein RHSIM_Rhsim09G0005600 [Rhododendron simsii]